MGLSGMLRNLKQKLPHTKNKGGSLTQEEKALVNALLHEGYRQQDIAFIINQGRFAQGQPVTVNQARITQSVDVATASDEQVKEYLKIQSAYDSKTLLNPYKEKDQRLICSREAMKAAVQIFNAPTMIFKAELFSVLSNIAWTYLIHEKLERVEKGSSKTSDGKSLSVSAILKQEQCPIKDKAVIANLKQVIEIRNQVEHTFFVGEDMIFGFLFQACCINFENHITEWFGSHLSLTKELSLALQFACLEKEQLADLEKSNLPPIIKTIRDKIQNSEFADNNAFQSKVYFTTELSPKTSAHVHKLIACEESESDKSDKLVAIKKVHYKRMTQNEIVEEVKKKGYEKFNNSDHKKCWMQRWNTAKERNEHAREYGEVLNKRQWFWYKQIWLKEVLEFCKKAGDQFK
ncbi:MAG: DUF3644 domain-containing protein [Acetobacter sp.]|nr:DUF3644 domain-containing protein [Acetobacter sp.]